MKIDGNCIGNALHVSCDRVATTSWIDGYSAAEHFPDDLRSLWKKGLLCENSGFGIGALAYFRRVIEEVVDMMIDYMAKATTDQASRDRIEAARKETAVSKKISFVKDLVPASFYIGTENPLGLMYGMASVGIHGASDEASLIDSHHLRQYAEIIISELVAQQKKADALPSLVAHLQRFQDIRPEDSPNV